MRFIIALFLLFYGLSASAQQDSFVVVKNIVLFGNKRTKEKIVLREMDIKPGDTLRAGKIDTLLKTNRNRIYNTSLFNEVTLSLLQRDTGAYRTLQVELRERWYIFPSPILELADRSFNEWWYNQGRSLSRLNYGIRFSDKNFRGRKEVLKLTLQGGFTTKLGLGYNVPYLNKKQTIGMDINLQYDQNKQVSYATKENKQMFLKTEDVLRERHRAGISFFLRKSFFATHWIELGYNFNKIADTIIKLNPNYFFNSRQSQRYYYFSYRFAYDHRDVRAYSLKGNYFQFNYDQMGFTDVDDIKLAAFYASYAHYLPLGRNFFVASSSKGKLYVPDPIPYFNMQGLGYDQNYVRGYDLYVVDGQSYFLQRTTFRKKLLESGIDLRSLLNIDQFSVVPFALYLNMYYDVGYTYSNKPYPGNHYLTNEWLRGGGIGLDLVTYYDSVIRFEYSFNKMMEHHLYLAFTSDI